MNDDGNITLKGKETSSNEDSKQANVYENYHAQCEELFNNATLSCLATGYIPFVIRNESNIYIVLSIVGLVNNSLSMMYFSHPQFKGVIMATTLRYYFISTFWASVAVLATKLINNNLFIISLVTIRISLGIMTYISVLRYLSVKKHFPPKNVRRHTLLLIFLVTFLTIASMVHKIVYQIVILVYMLTAALTTLAFNILTVMTERLRMIQMDKDSGCYNILQRFTKYIIISNALNTISTIPMAIYKCLVDSSIRITCDDCHAAKALYIHLRSLYLANVFFDNTFYCILSSEYRHGLIRALKRIWSKTPPQPFTRSFMNDSTAMNNVDTDNETKTDTETHANNKQ